MSGGVDAVPTEAVAVTWAEVRVVRRVQPAWPEGADSAVEVYCLVAVELDAAGRVITSEASGCAAPFAAEAEAALARWRFAWAPGFVPAERSVLEMRLRFPTDSVRAGEIGGGLQLTAAAGWSFAGAGFDRPLGVTVEAGFWGSGGEGGLVVGAWHDGGQVGVSARAPLGRAAVAFSPGLGSALRLHPGGLSLGLEGTVGATVNPFARGPTLGVEGFGGAWTGFTTDANRDEAPSGWEVGLRVRAGWRFRDRASGE